MTDTVKAAAAELIAQLPDDCTWDDVMYRVYLRQEIQEGLDDEAAGRVAPLDIEAIKKELRERLSGRQAS